MKNNFKKIIVGLLMLSSFTGCGDLNNSTFNTENLSSKISDILNNSTDHKHSSSDNSNDVITSNSNSSEDKQSSSSDKTSSGSNSSSSNQGKEEINSNEVSKDTWEKAQDATILSDVTIEASLEGGMEVPNMPSYISAGISMFGKLKVADGKAHILEEQSSVMIIDKTVLMEDMQLTDEQAEMVIAQLLSQLGEEAVKDGNTYKINMGTQSYEDFLEKETNETAFQYDYREHFRKYYRSRTLINFDEEALGQFVSFLAKDSFEDAQYDQTKKAYYLDGLHLGEDVIEAGFTGGLYYYFVGDKLFKITIEGMAEGTEATYDIYFKDYGSTSVTLPSQDMIQPCDHLVSNYQSNNNEYHYMECSTCWSVLEYEKHEFGAHDCPECGYYPTRRELVTVEGIDSAISVYKIYNTLDNKLSGIDFRFTGTGSSSWGSIYDPETGEVIGEEIRSSSSQQYIVGTWVEEKVDGECRVIRNATYNFIDRNTNEAVCEPLVVVINITEHNYIEGDSIVNGCQRINSKVCQDCSRTESSIYYVHDYNDVIYGEKDDTCFVTGSASCKNCSHVEYYAEEDHDFEFTILDKDNHLATITCSDCGLNETGTYYFNGYNDLRHGIEFRTADYDYYYFYEEHEFVDNHCDCGYTQYIEDIK